MEWTRATEEAARIAGRWTAEGGPGGAIVLFNGSDIHSEAFGGLASLELNLPFTAETVVRYASISKHFCAALLLRLQADGVLSLDDALGVHLPMLARAPATVPIAPCARHDRRPAGHHGDAVAAGRAVDRDNGSPCLARFHQCG